MGARVLSLNVPVMPHWKLSRAERPSGAADRSAVPDQTLAAAAEKRLTMAADDRTLVEACLGGDKSAFDILVERHRRQVYQVCYRFVGNHEDASDLAQDVFIRAYRALGTFKGRSAFGTWLYRVAVNVCLNRVSAKQPAVEALDSHEHQDTRTERPDAVVMRDEQAQVVRAAIARLPRKQRATMILRMYHELPHEQIAAILGSSVGAVKANFFHALANLKKLLQEGGR
jgi:RNA polymerase sigma-70 factor (ECF subfamily)